MTNWEETEQRCLATTNEVLAEFAETLGEAGIVIGDPGIEVRHPGVGEYESEIVVLLYDRADGNIFDVIEFHSVWGGRPQGTDEELRSWLRSVLTDVCSRGVK